MADLDDFYKLFNDLVKQTQELDGLTYQQEYQSINRLRRSKVTNYADEEAGLNHRLYLEYLESYKLCGSGCGTLTKVGGHQCRNCSELTCESCARGNHLCQHCFQMFQRGMR